MQETPYSGDIAPLITDPANWAANCVPNRGGTEGSAIVNATDAIVGRAKACRKARGKLPNLIAVDMFQSGGLFAAVKRLNGLR